MSQESPGVRKITLDDARFRRPAKDIAPPNPTTSSDTPTVPAEVTLSEADLPSDAPSAPAQMPPLKPRRLAHPSPSYTPRCQTFVQAQAMAKRLLPLPREMQTSRLLTRHHWLVAQLERANTPEALLALATHLTHKDVAVLFPTLATVTKRSTMERIHTLIRARASAYLYYQGWITLQFAFPRPAVARGLSDLCVQLEERLGGFARVAAPSHDTERVRGGHIAWGDIPLISKVALPTHRRFIETLADAARHAPTPAIFFRTYALYDDLALGKAVWAKLKALENDPSSERSLASRLFERPKRT